MRTEVLHPTLAGQRSRAAQTAPAFTDGPRVSMRHRPRPNIRRTITPEQVCVLTFDRPGSSANVFDRATLEELDAHVDFITGKRQFKGVVITSAKPAIFIAGADLHALSAAASQHSQPPPAELGNLVRLGQRVFNRLAALPVPTVAAIHGACLGGGYELCLACDYRLASPDCVTQIGLPETQLGILPAWGGCTRLPRLIGLPKALNVILAGKPFPAHRALKCGLVDEVVPREQLVPQACKRITPAGPGLRFRRRRLPLVATNNVFAAFALATVLRGRLWKQTRGHYPAVLQALEVVSHSVTRSLDESLASERQAVLELAQTEACHNLVNLFFQQERAKKLTVAAAASPPTSHGRHRAATVAKAAAVRRCAVIGAGVMGTGIAQWFSARGVPVILRDVSAEQVAKGMTGIARLYQAGVKRHVFTPLVARQGMDRIFPTMTETPLQNVDLVIEAAVEKMDLKQQIFRRLASQAGPETILATNTSALSITAIAEATGAPERVVGLHFFNPVHRMPLVEVVAGRQTDPTVVQRAVRFVQHVGKLPVVVRDSPGFLVNRVLMPYLLEAGRLFEAGARVQDIDEAMLNFGMPMGPLRLIDEVGLDVARHVAETLAASFPDRFARPALLERMIEAGLLGRKSDHGFYFHGTNPPTAYAGLKLFQGSDTARGTSRDELQLRMVLLMINEAARCLEESVVATPGDVDFAMIMGTGFAPFRGGPLRYADRLGLSRIVNDLKRLTEADGPRFQPCELLQSKAAKAETFHSRQGGTP